MGPRERIKLGCLVLKKTQTGIAEAIGTSKQEVAHVGPRYTSGKIVEGVARELQCSPLWLITGEGEPPEWYRLASLGGSDERKTPRVADMMRGYAPSREELLEMVARLQLQNEQLIAEIDAMRQREDSVRDEIGATESLSAAGEAELARLRAEHSQMIAERARLLSRLGERERQPADAPSEPTAGPGEA